MSSSFITPLSQIKVSTYTIPRHNGFPNSGPHNKPLIVYHSLFFKSDKASVTAYLENANIIKPQWTYTFFPTSHFHTNVHEVIVVLSGAARLLFGGEDNPGKVEVSVKAGDAMVIPAGIAHKMGPEMGKDVFEVLGCYPIGSPDWNMCYGKPGEGDVEKSIKSLQWLDKDPFYGSEGPALRV